MNDILDDMVTERLEILEALGDESRPDVLRALLDELTEIDIMIVAQRANIRADATQFYIPLARGRIELDS